MITSGTAANSTESHLVPDRDLILDYFSQQPVESWNAVQLGALRTLPMIPMAVQARHAGKQKPPPQQQQQQQLTSAAALFGADGTDTSEGKSTEPRVWCAAAAIPSPLLAPSCMVGSAFLLDARYITASIAAPWQALLLAMKVPAQALSEFIMDALLPKLPSLAEAEQVNAMLVS